MRVMRPLVTLGAGAAMLALSVVVWPAVLVYARWREIRAARRRI